MNVKKPKRAAPEWRTTAKANALKGYVEAAVDDVSFDEIRANVPALADMPEGHIHQLAIDAGLEVDG